MNNDRYLTINPSFDTKQVCVVLSAEGHESINELFTYRLHILTANTAIKPEDIIGSSINFAVRMNQDNQWKIQQNYHGIIVECVAKEITRYTVGSQTLELKGYDLVIMPALTLLSHTLHNRVFQKKGQTTMDIVTGLLQHYKITFKNLVGKGQIKPFCVQYQCSDLDFIKRLLAESGAYFYFTHTNDSHTLVISNKTSDYIQTKQNLSHKSDAGEGFAVQSWQTVYRLCATVIASNDFNVNQPSQNLYKKQKIQSQQTITSGINQFYFPGQFPDSTSGTEQVKNAAAEHENKAMDVTAISNAPMLLAGTVFNINGNYFSATTEKNWLVKKQSWSASDKRGLGLEENQGGLIYTNELSLIPATQLALPSQIRFGRMPGIQIALVVNSQGETNSNQPVYCDSLGQICVKFLWENYPEAEITSNKYDACLVPIMHQWTNGIYRVGTPVLVGFFNDDIDRPVVLGPMNDANHLLQGQYSDTNNLTSMIKQWPGSDDGSNYNSIQFNDKKGQENMALFAGKDMQTTVNKGNQSLVVKQGKRSISVADDESHENKKNYQHTVKEKYVLQVDGDLVLDIGGNIEIKSKKQITITSDEATKISAEHVNVDGNTGVNIC